MRFDVVYLPEDCSRYWSGDGGPGFCLMLVTKMANGHGKLSKISE